MIMNKMLGNKLANNIMKGTGKLSLNTDKNSLNDSNIETNIETKESIHNIKHIQDNQNLNEE